MDYEFDRLTSVDEAARKLEGQLDDFLNTKLPIQVKTVDDLVFYDRVVTAAKTARTLRRNLWRIN